MAERVIGIEVYCNTCGRSASYHDEMKAELETPGITHRCEHCWSEDIQRDPFVECDCGERVYLSGDSQCPECGQWYNGFGQQLKDPSEWPDDDED